MNKKLQDLGSEHDWSHIKNQNGMFAFTGLKPEMVEEMISKYSIHFTLDGRINLAGLNQKNIDIVCQAIHDVTKGKKL